MKWKDGASTFSVFLVSEMLARSLPQYYFFVLLVLFTLEWLKSVLLPAGTGPLSFLRLCYNLELLMEEKPVTYRTRRCHSRMDKRRGWQQGMDSIGLAKAGIKQLIRSAITGALPSCPFAPHPCLHKQSLFVPSALCSASSLDHIFVHRWKPGPALAEGKVRAHSSSPRSCPHTMINTNSGPLAPHTPSLCVHSNECHSTILALRPRQRRAACLAVNLLLPPHSSLPVLLVLGSWHLPSLPQWKSRHSPAPPSLKNLRVHCYVMLLSNR